MKRSRVLRIGILSGAVLLGALTGCVGHGEWPRRAREDAQPPPNYVETEVVMLQNNYVYYPEYQVYYISNLREYVYLQDHSWVSRPAPPRVPAEVLFASPSVRLDFHDSPSVHHASVSREYPKHMAKPGSSRGQKGSRD